MLKGLLNTWCRASGAKFNLDKTEIIPIGTEQFQTKVIESRQLNVNEGGTIPDHMKIAVEGQPIRTLETWIGNKVDQATP